MSVHYGTHINPAIHVQYLFVELNARTSDVSKRHPVIHMQMQHLSVKISGKIKNISKRHADIHIQMKKNVRQTKCNNEIYQQNKACFSYANVAPSDK